MVPRSIPLEFYDPKGGGGSACVFYLENKRVTQVLLLIVRVGCVWLGLVGYLQVSTVMC